MIATVIDPAGALARLRAVRERLRTELRLRFAELAPALLAAVQAKVSGEALNVRTGALRASLKAEIVEEPNGLAARVFSDGSVAYAHIQEYGGRIAIPDIVPRDARALAFAWGGRLVFAHHVQAHAVAIPERRYLRRSLEEFAPVFADTIRKIADEVER